MFKQAGYLFVSWVVLFTVTLTSKNSMCYLYWKNRYGSVCETLTMSGDWGWRFSLGLVQGSCPRLWLWVRHHVPVLTLLSHSIWWRSCLLLPIGRGGGAHTHTHCHNCSLNWPSLEGQLYRTDKAIFCKWIINITLFNICTPPSCSAHTHPYPESSYVHMHIHARTHVHTHTYIHTSQKLRM